MKNKVVRYELNSKMLVKSLLSLIASLLVPVLIAFTIISI
jgi:hypothetical protein